MFKNILIPTDGSEQSQRAVKTGIELAKLHGARVTGIHVIPDYHLLIAYEGAFDPVTEERIEEEAKARADTYLNHIREAAAAAFAPLPVCGMPSASRTASDDVIAAAP